MSNAPIPHLTLAPLLGVVALLSACAVPGSARHFDVDAFLRGSDTALPEVIGNADFLKSTRVSVTECATLLQSPASGALEDLPATGLRPAWLLHPAGTPDKVWLIVSEASGERSCHGPLPADAMKTLAERAKG
ncbi:hypothetical protein [Cupriavidus pampae]|uniref:Lipoprotein transmembrane n=1 Tax=Cupriavidus pampae TaxID=659251 RepID=A0ABN7Z0E7_9BURK|nr:hypothetical protein [Cupriavidus pampae]CAG9179458.1 hypothetical protein LMG32289_04362 [Cupriavidus pampae]